MHKKNRRPLVAGTTDGVFQSMTSKKWKPPFDGQAPSAPYVRMKPPPINLIALLHKTLDIAAELGDDESLYDFLTEDEIHAVRRYFLPVLRGEDGPCK